MTTLQPCSAAAHLTTMAVAESGVPFGGGSIVKSCAIGVLLLWVASSVIASPSGRIAEMERSISPLVIISGETPPAASLTQRMNQLQVPAVSIAVISEGKIDWARAYGY